MADCPSLPKCPFFNDSMATKPATAEMMKNSYCRTDNTHCARWMVAQALGKAAVPMNLFPAQADRAEQIILAGQG